MVQHPHQNMPSKVSTKSVIELSTKAISIFIVFTIQFFGIVWWMAKLDSRVEYLEYRLSETDKSMPAILQQQAVVLGKLDYLKEKVDNTTDKLDKILSDGYKGK